MHKSLWGTYHLHISLGSVLGQSNGGNRAKKSRSGYLFWGTHKPWRCSHPRANKLNDHRGWSTAPTAEGRVAEHQEEDKQDHRAKVKSSAGCTQLISENKRQIGFEGAAVERKQRLYTMGQSQLTHDVSELKDHEQAFQFGTEEDRRPKIRFMECF